MNLLSIYSGIGGIDLAAHWAGMTTVAMCDSDAFCRRILSRHWPEVPIFESDEQVTASALWERGIDRIDIIAGGPPCQPFSVAGKRGGTADPRHRWPEMARIVAEFRPRWVVVENVGGFLDVAVPLVLPDLEAMGYDAWAVEIPAAAVGAPHGRARIFIVAYADGLRGLQPEGRVADEWRRTSNSGSGTMANTGRRSVQRRTDGGDVHGEAGARVSEGAERERIRNDHCDGGSARDAGAVGNSSRSDERRDWVCDESRGVAPRGSGGVVRTLADTTEQRRSGCGPARDGWNGSSDGGRCGTVEHTTGSRPEEGRQGATEIIGRSAGRGERGRADASALESRLGRVLDGTSDRMDAARWPAPRRCQQFDYEPPRVTTERENRRKRVKALGNAVVPLQVYPILALIAELWSVESLEGAA